MDYNEKLELIERLWGKYSYKDNQGYKSDRAMIIKDYKEITGESIASSTLSNYTSKFDLEKAFLQSGNDGSRVNNDETVVENYSENRKGEITSTIRQRMREKTQFTNKELLELHTINSEENEIKQIVSNEWSMTNKDGETYYNFQSKIIAVPIGEKGMPMDEFIAAIKNDPKPMLITPVGIGTRHLGIGLADLHFGRTTKEMLKSHLMQILDIIENGYDTILIAQLGDAFESSQIKQSITLAGTILPSADMVKALQDFKWFMHALIEHSAKHCRKVIVTSVCGNHSGNLEFVAMDALKDRYSLLQHVDKNGEYLGTGKVTVRAGNDYRTVEMLGKNGIMLSHGDGVKLKDLPLKFASEYKLVWADSEHTEAWSGHKHNKFTETDIDGTVMRQFPSPKPPTDYEDRWGYNSRELMMAVEFSDDTSKVIYEIK